MTRPIDVEASLQNRRMEEAVEGVISGRYKDCAEAAQIVEVPYSILRHRVNGRQIRVQSHEDQQVLSEEETELERWVCQLTVQCYLPKTVCSPRNGRSNSNSTRHRN